MSKQNSPSKVSATKTIHAAFKLIKDNGGSMAIRDILEGLRTQLSFSEWEKAPLEKTGNVRWESIFYWYSVDSVKAGFLVKNNGVWSVTPEGEKAIKAGPDGLMDAANSAYRAWAKDNQRPTKPEVEGEEEVLTSTEVNIELTEGKAREGLMGHLRKKNGYEFQQVVAALLRAMGYYTPYIAAGGPDGGVDIIAYLDPLGVKTPRVVVQVKHKPDAAIPPAEVQSLIGTLNIVDDVRLFVTSGQFSSKAQQVARAARTHCELIDGNRFIELWKEHYGKMPDEDKVLLPLHAIWFLGNTD